MIRAARCLAVLAVVLVGCKTTQSAQGTAATELFGALGGLSGVTQVAERFVTKLGAAKAVEGALESADLEALKTGLVNEVAKGSDVPLPHPGSDFEAVLKQKLKEKPQREAVLSSLSAAVQELNLPQEHQVGLIQLVQPMTGTP